MNNAASQKLQKKGLQTFDKILTIGTNPAIRIRNRINLRTCEQDIRIRNLQFELRNRIIIFFMSSSLFVRLFCNLLTDKVVSTTISLTKII